MSSTQYQSDLSNFISESTGSEELKALEQSQENAKVNAKNQLQEVTGTELLGLGAPLSSSLIKSSISATGLGERVSSFLDDVESTLPDGVAREFRFGRNLAGKALGGDSFEPSLAPRQPPSAPAPEIQETNIDQEFQERYPNIQETNVDQAMAPPTQEQALSQIQSQPRTAPTNDDLPEGAGEIQSEPASAAASTEASSAEATSSATEAVGGALEEATADSAVLDETPVGAVITGVLGVASLAVEAYEGIKDLFHHHHSHPVAQPPPAPSVSFQAGVTG